MSYNHTPSGDSNSVMSMNDASSRLTQEPKREGELRQEQRVSVMYGDRLCTTCHYNLIGQPVIREPHYDLLVVRCPECATVASLQEYPHLGRWANRWSVIFSGIWIMLLLALASGGIAAVIGMTGGFTEEAVDQYENDLQKHWSDWYAETYPNATSKNQWWNPDKFDEWTVAHTPSKLMTELHAVNGLFRQPETLLFIVPLFITSVLGVFWSVALVHRRRLTLFLMSVVLLILAGAIYGTIWWQIAQFPADDFDDIAWVQIGMPLMATMLGLCWFLLVTGLLCGRPVARWLVRVMLPPRLLGPLNVLWLTDGLTPPQARELAT